MKQVRVRLEGEHAQLGDVPARDVANLIIAVENAARRAAAVVIRQPKTTTGRYKGAIEQAVQFRLLGIETGSVVAALELPEVLEADEDQTLDLEDPKLGVLAMEALLRQAEAPEDPNLARALLTVADDLRIGDRYERVTFDVSDDSSSRRRIVVDAPVRDRLRTYVESTPAPEPRSDELTGRLFEADFEKKTARLRAPTGDAIEVSFDDEQADAIQDALRQLSTVSGDVAFDAKTNVAKRVTLRRIVVGVEQLALDSQDYWSALSIADLAAKQGTGQVVSLDVLYDTEATDDERDSFVEAIAELG